MESELHTAVLAWLKLRRQFGGAHDPAKDYSQIGEALRKAEAALEVEAQRLESKEGQDDERRAGQ